MGLFDQKDDQDKEALKKLNKIINDLNFLYRTDYAQVKDRRFYQYLVAASKRPDSTLIQPFSLFVEIVSTITSNQVDYNVTSYMNGLQRAEEIYLKMFPYKEDTPGYSMLTLAFINFFRAGGLATTNWFDSTLMSTFKNKVNYIDFMNTITGDPKLKECMSDIIQYGLSVRAFFVDDETYTAHMKQAAKKMLKAGNRAEVIKEETQIVEHMAGIYDIDEADVARTEQQLVKASSMLKTSMEVLEQADKKSQQLNRIMQDTTESLQEIAKRETDLLTIKVNSARENLDAAYNSFLEEQRQEINLQKDIFLNQLFKEAELKINELKAMARTITSSANSELMKINTETSSALEKINNYVANDKELKKVLAKANDNQELFDKIAKLEVLNTHNIDAIAKDIEARLATQGNGQALATVQATAQIPAQVVVPDSTVAVTAPTELPTIELVPAGIPKTNPFLDTSVPFQQRYKAVMEEKKKRIEQGEHFHVMFDDVVAILMEDANPYLIGPSGCGKTFMVKQIASILQLDFIDIGYINEEYDILGFQTATGAYSTPNFYRCYKYGKIAFCDELDNGNSRATVKLNSFLSNGKDACYSFPHGENVKRHANFRIIAAGNTAGNGADENYNTREKIEESVQQRFTPIYINYDNAVEEKILGTYKDWFQFVVLFRAATDAWGNLKDCSAPGILTTRDAARIRKYLDNKSLDMARILDYEFIQTKDMEYLAYLSKHMGENVEKHPDAKKIYAMFDKKVNDLRAKGGLR